MRRFTLLVALLVGCSINASRTEPLGPLGDDNDELVDAGLIDAGPIDVEPDTHEGPLIDDDIEVPGEAEGIPLPSLRIGLVVHLEGGWLGPTADHTAEERYWNYAGEIRQYAALASLHGAKPTWEARHLIRPVNDYDPGLFRELVALGHAVGGHADIGGDSMSPLTQSQMELELGILRTDLLALGANSRDVSGVCSHLDWVKAADVAGYRSVTGIVRYCLKALPLGQRPANIHRCTRAADCHQVWPATAAERIHPWRVLNGASLTTHTPRASTVLVPSSGEITCLYENLDGTSHTNCRFTREDIDTAQDAIREALLLRRADKMNQLHFVWSLGKAVPKPLFQELLLMIARYVRVGAVRWQTIDEMVDEYLALPFERQVP